MHAERKSHSRAAAAETPPPPPPSLRMRNLDAAGALSRDEWAASPLPARFAALAAGA
jgi:hypothetical protein